MGLVFTSLLLRALGQHFYASEATGLIKTRQPNFNPKGAHIMKILTAMLLMLSAATANAQKPFVLGEIRELQSVILKETRTLNIYLPEGYKAADTAKYPVIYLLDGSADEDFIHIAGLVQFNSFPWVGHLPPSIVVGIANVSRQRDFTFPTSVKKDKELVKQSGGSEAFISFIEKELQPFIGHTFRTAPSKTIIGESLGGLLATEILFTKPGLFDKYIIVSPSLWWDGGSLLRRTPMIPADSSGRKTDIYIAVGKEGLTPSEPPRVMEVDANLLADKLRAAKRKNQRILFDYLPGEDHATIMHQAVMNAFKLLHTAR